jgi:amino acid adenylation domain-containing protein
MLKTPGARAYRTHSGNHGDGTAISASVDPQLRGMSFERPAERPGTPTSLFSSVLIGEGTLLIRCAEILLEQGHPIVAIASPDPEVRRWANGRAIDAVQPREDLFALLASQPFDYLLSIVNFTVLPREVLALPRHAAINYHDAPLPRYAGMHATSWALINQEPRHGVSWHVASEMIDGGDVLVQAEVPVEPGDTALTLNLRCYEAAVSSFRTLVSTLARGDAVPRPQDLSQRTYFPLHKRPEAAGLLDWRRPAAALDALVRGLSFGPYPNPLGFPKIDLGNELVCVAESEPVPNAIAAVPGTVLEITSAAIVVATGSGGLRLRGFSRLDGSELELARMVAVHGLERGAVLPVLSDSERAKISEIAADLAKHERYWLKRIARPQPLSLPRLATETPDGRRRRTFELPAPASVGVDHPPLDVPRLVSAFAVYLARISGSHSFDLAFWTATRAQRLELPRPLLSDWVPLRIEIDPEAAFDETSREIRRRLEDAGRRGTYAADLASRHRSAGARPAYGVAVAIRSERHLPPPPPNGCAWMLEVVEPDLSLRASVDESAFDAATVERMAAEWGTLLEHAVSEPQRAVGDLELIPPADLRTLVHDWNRTEAPYPRDACVHDLVEAQVDRTPQRIAVGFDGSTLSYAQLDARANQIAHVLAQRGVQPGHCVGVFLERSLDLVPAILGIMKAGATYLPLDPLYPVDRIGFMLADGRCELVLTQATMLDRLPTDQARVLILDGEPSPLAAVPSTRPRKAGNPTRPAYLIYTSGSTGKPKGVRVPHGGVVNFLMSMSREPGLVADDVLVAVTTICFDISVLELFLPLTVGARVEIAGRSIASDGIALAKKLASSRATVFQATPATYRLLLEARWEGLRGLKALCGGEPLPRELAGAILDRTGELWNLYGPTETTIWSTASRIYSDAGEISIGRPIANTTTYVVDPRMRLVPVGCVGELLIGGDGVVEGYHQRPELTAERFVQVSFGEKEERVYRTGDLARYERDGRLECLGRIDHQVKVRGFRIELGEIESVLDQHPDVNASIVVARPDASGEQQLVAYAMSPARGDHDRLIGELRERLRAALPAYMVPASFMILDELPLTENRKVDRKALPKPPLRAAFQEASTLDPPRSDLERTVADVWSAVLGVPVGREDDFFSLGGHSLLVQRLITQLEEKTGRTVTTVDVYRHPTVASLTGLLDRSAAEQATEGEAREVGHVPTTRTKVGWIFRRFLVPRFAVSLYYFLRYGVKISPRSEVELSPRLTFGRGSLVGSFTKIKATDGPVRFGDRCGVGNFCVIAGGARGLHIGDNFLCGPHVTILSSNYVYDRVGVHLWEQGQVSAGVRIGNNVWLGAGVTILDGTELGDDTIVVAGSVVDRKHPPAVILRGNPAQVIGHRSGEMASGHAPRVGS